MADLIFHKNFNSCSKCSVQFDCSAKFKTHKEEKCHTNEKCEHCNEIFLSLESLRNHQQSSTCECCGLEFQCLGEKQVHDKTEFSRCLHCASVLHAGMEHLVHKELNECTDCNLKFLCQSQLELHFSTMACHLTPIEPPSMLLLQQLLSSEKDKPREKQPDNFFTQINSDSEICISIEKNHMTPASLFPQKKVRKKPGRKKKFVEKSLICNNCKITCKSFRGLRIHQSRSICDIELFGVNFQCAYCGLCSGKQRTMKKHQSNNCCLKCDGLFLGCELAVKDHFSKVHVLVTPAKNKIASAGREKAEAAISTPVGDNPQVRLSNGVHLDQELSVSERVEILMEVKGAGKCPLCLINFQSAEELKIHIDKEHQLSPLIFQKDLLLVDQLGGARSFQKEFITKISQSKMFLKQIENVKLGGKKLGSSENKTIKVEYNKIIDDEIEILGEIYGAVHCKTENQNNLHI